MSEGGGGGGPVAIGLDVGTSALKAVAVDTRGVVVAEASASYPLLTPRVGWTEQDPHEWAVAAWSALRDVVRAVAGREVLALGLAGQMHGLVALDRHGGVIRPAPLWNDQRTGNAVHEIEERVPRDDLVARTGNRAVTGFQLPKLLWLRAEEPEAYARTRHALLPKDYLRFVLTGELATEPSDASGVGALNLARLAWDEDVLGALDVDVSLFPAVAASHAVTGRLRAELAAELGLPPNLPVVGGAGDNAGAAVGLGLSHARPGVGSLSLGTSGVIFLPLQAPTPDPEGRVHLFAHADGGYHLLGVTLAAAGALQWFHDALAPEASFESLLTEAADVPPGADGVTFVPYLAGERSPFMTPDARGVFAGLSLAHGRAHMVRAVVEGTVFALADTLDVMTPLARAERLLATGGGARSDLWLGVARSVLGVPLVRPAEEGSPARGAAILALVGAEVYPDVASAIAATAPDTTDVAAPDRPYDDAVRARYREASAWARGRA